MDSILPFVPDLSIERHGVIGDRRTAALVGADGALNWLCLPDYDSASVFGALLDAEHGGFWYFGPRVRHIGRQHYPDGYAMLITIWTADNWTLELTDAMIWPERDRPAETVAQRVIVRRLRCVRGAVACAMQIHPRHDFVAAASVAAAPNGLLFGVGDHQLGFWATFAVTADARGAGAAFTLQGGDECWAVFGLNTTPAEWSVRRAQACFDALKTYWRGWQDTLTYAGPRRAGVLRSAMLIHLLSYVPGGAVVAAPTTSLPERIGGDLNWDYRFTWVRDASLAFAIPSLLDNTDDVEHFLDWLSQLGSSTAAPLQVVYRINGDTDLSERQRIDIHGYRRSRPIRIGNRAAGQVQPGSFGYLADCALIYLTQGGRWNEQYWELIRRAANHIAATWRQPDSGIWELPDQAHYVSSKVMSWVTLDRAIKIAERTNTDYDDAWRAARDAIHAEVMEQGWSAQMQAFRQRYNAETLDAATLLIAVMDFLPADHPRMQATVERIVETLTIDGFVYRFVPKDTLGQLPLPLGDFEGAFLPCTFWLAITYARMGRINEANSILDRAEAVAGNLGLFAEEIDPRNQTFLGNFPLLFSQAEYVRAVLEIARTTCSSHRGGDYDR